MIQGRRQFRRDSAAHPRRGERRRHHLASPSMYCLSGQAQAGSFGKTRNVGRISGALVSRASTAF